MLLDESYKERPHSDQTLFLNIFLMFEGVCIEKQWQITSSKDVPDNKAVFLGICNKIAAINAHQQNPLALLVPD